MASREGSTGRPPGDTESNANIRAFPELPDDLLKHHSKADADGSNENNNNHSEADADGYLQSMSMNGWSDILHSEDNQS